MTSDAKLTRQQQRVLSYVRQHLRVQGMPPTRKEIATALGFSAVNTAQAHLKALARKGYIELPAGLNRNIRLRPQARSAAKPSSAGDATGEAGIPLIGRVAAGVPTLALEHVEGYFDCAALFSPAADFLLRVVGDSMTGADIHDGDLVAVHNTSQARDGQVVVARLDDEVTVKTLQLERRQVRLLPANPDFWPIKVDPERQSLTIEGVVVGTVRRRPRF